MGKKNQKDKIPPINFNAPNELREKIKLAEEATGSTRTILLQRLVDQFLPDLVRLIQQEQGRAARRLEELAGHRPKQGGE